MARPRSRRRAPLLRRTAAALAMAATAFAVHACSRGGDGPAPRICPRVDVLEYARSLTAFAGGSGREMTDAVLHARIADVDGECDLGKGAATLDFTVDFSLRRGLADRTGTARFAYFIAIPELRPDPGAKRIFPVEVDFQAARGPLRHREKISVELPLAGDRRAADFTVLVGFQLDGEQLDYNRSLRRARPGSAPGG